MITSKFLLSVIRLNFVNVVNGKGKANAVNASPPCFMISRLVIIYFWAKIRRFLLLRQCRNNLMRIICIKFAKEKNYNVEIEYAGTLEIMQKLNNGEKYDGVWLSNSMCSVSRSTLDAEVVLEAPTGWAKI